MDEADLAQARAEREDEARRRFRVAPRESVGPYTGYCYNCGVPVIDPRRWCDADCRDDWEKRHA